MPGSQKEWLYQASHIDSGLAQWLGFSFGFSPPGNEESWRILMFKFKMGIPYEIIWNHMKSGQFIYSLAWFSITTSAREHRIEDGDIARKHWIWSAGCVACMHIGITIHIMVQVQHKICVVWVEACWTETNSSSFGSISIALRKIYREYPEAGPQSYVHHQWLWWGRPSPREIMVNPYM